MNTDNARPHIEGIIPGLLYLTGEEPMGKVFVWGETSESVFHIAAFGEGGIMPLPAAAVRSLNSATIVGFGQGPVLDERIHQICTMYVAAGVIVKGRYRVEGAQYCTVPATPAERPKAELLPIAPEFEAPELELAPNLTSAEFQLAAAQYNLELQRAHPDDQLAYQAAVDAAGSGVLELLKEGRAVEHLTTAQRMHLTSWLAGEPGFRTALELTGSFGPPHWFVEHWTRLLAMVPATFTPIAASLLAVAAWRARRPLLARRANDLAAECASNLLPPVHEMVADAITTSIRQLVGANRGA